MAWRRSRRREQAAGLVNSSRFGGAHHRKVDVGLGDVVEKVGQEVLRHDRDDLDDLCFAEAGQLHGADIGVAHLAAALRNYSMPRGELVITAPVVFGRLHVLPVIGEFLASFPDINARLLLSDRNVHLIDNQVDMAVRIGALPDSSMVATRVGHVRQVVCGSPAYFASHGAPKKPRELSGRARVAFDVLGPATAWNFAVPGAKAEQPVPIRSRLSVNTAEAAVDAAVAGVGVTRVLSYQVADVVERGELQIVLADFEAEPLPVNLVHAGQGLLPLKMRSFLEFAAPRLRERLLLIASKTKQANA